MKKITGSYFYLLLLILQLSYLLLYFTAPHFWFLQIFSVIPPFLFLVPGCICLLISIFKRDIIAILLSLSCGLLGFLFIEFNPSILFGGQIQDTQNSIIVFNSNTTLWNQKDPAEYMQFLKSQNADIYQLQEIVSPRHKEQSNKAIFEKYFSDYTIVSNNELVTLSKLPVIQQEYKDGDFQKVTIKLKGKDVDFYNVHMRIHLLPDLITQPQEFMRELKERYYWRDQQFAQLLSNVEQSKRVYISGDFNTSKAMGMMRPLQEITQDSFSRSADLFPITWNMKDLTQWWRIDYNLLKGVKLLKHENIEQEEYSDHRAQRVFIDLD